MFEAGLKDRLVNLGLTATNSRLASHNPLRICCLQPAKSTKKDSGEGSRKPRKHNFSASEIAILTEKVEENLAILQSKLTNTVTNLKKKEVWSQITPAVNAVGVDKRTVTEVREKWKNLHSTAKREFTNFRKESKKTGGGPAPKEISAATSKVIELFQDTPSFVGLAGFETNCPNGKAITFFMSLTFIL